MAKIIIAGGSGFLGSHLTSFFLNKGITPVILSRKRSGNANGVLYIKWDGQHLGDWVSELDNARALINLSGRSINTTFSDTHKKEILDSRIKTTHLLGQGISQCTRPPAVWINGSAVGYYGDRGNEKLSEKSDPGSGFVAHVCKEWEHALFSFSLPETRTIAVRTSLVLNMEGGVLPPLIRLSKLGLGGKAGNGRQYMPWIHLHDWIRLVDWIIDTPAIRGPVIAAAPETVTNKQFMHKLRNALQTSIGIPQPAFLLRIAGKIIGPDSELILAGQKAYPAIAINHGFSYQFPTLDSAFSDLFE